ncbi:hypothetical protein [Chthoniobacter flavus]|nr:hypothetical protein [Chthoniobacter flavus]
MNLAFLDGSTPSITAFGFYLRAPNDSTSLVRVTAVTAQSGDYPYSFTFSPCSPTLSAVLGNDQSANLLGFITWTDGSTINSLEPFNIRVINSSVTDINYVMSLNGLEGTVGITGSGLTVSTDGNNVLLDTAIQYQDYSTPSVGETKTLTVDSKRLWVIDCTQSNATLALPDASTVDGRDYTFKKVDTSGNTLTALASSGQKIEGKDGVYVADQWEAIHLLAVNGSWLVLDALNLL